jgi:hypothetical protein
MNKHAFIEGYLISSLLLKESNQEDFDKELNSSSTFETEEDKLKYTVEDILYGLEHYPELRPKDERIAALKFLNSNNAHIKDMINIWSSGHGVLSKPNRILALRTEFEKINQNI